MRATERKNRKIATNRDVRIIFPRLFLTVVSYHKTGPLIPNDVAKGPSLDSAKRTHHGTV
jgi:hypothetical protein